MRDQKRQAELAASLNADGVAGPCERALEIQLHELLLFAFALKLPGLAHVARAAMRARCE